MAVLSNVSVGYGYNSDMEDQDQLSEDFTAKFMQLRVATNRVKQIAVETELMDVKFTGVQLKVVT